MSITRTLSVLKYPPLYKIVKGEEKEKLRETKSSEAALQPGLTALLLRRQRLQAGSSPRRVSSCEPLLQVLRFQARLHRAPHEVQRAGKSPAVPLMLRWEGSLLVRPAVQVAFLQAIPGTSFPRAALGLQPSHCLPCAKVARGPRSLGVTGEGLSSSPPELGRSTQQWQSPSQRRMIATTLTAWTCVHPSS